MKRYRLCAQCGQIIRTNKLLFGAMHVCLEDKEYHELPLFMKQRMLENAEAYGEKVVL